MSNTPESTRGPGKRQIKKTQKMENFVSQQVERKDVRKPLQRRTNKKTFESMSGGDNTSITLVNDQFSEKSAGYH